VDVSAMPDVLQQLRKAVIDAKIAMSAEQAARIRLDLPAARCICEKSLASSLSNLLRPSSNAQLPREAGA